MKNAMIVYVGLTVLILIPIVWYGLKRLLNKQVTAVNRYRPAALFAALAVIVCLLGWVLYQFTIRSQPIMVISRFATEARNGVDTKTLVGKEILRSDAGDITDIAEELRGTNPLKLSKTDEDGESYYLLIDKENAIVAKVTLQSNGDYYYIISSASLLQAQDAATAIKESSFFSIN